MRRIKLFTSIMCLCVSFLSLAFGVYAAISSLTYDMTGSISYEVTNAYAKVKTYVYSGDYQYTSASELKADAQMLETLDMEIDGPYGSTQGELSDVEISDSELDSSKGNTSKQLTNIDIAYSEDDNIYAYFIVISVKNLTKEITQYVKVTDNNNNQIWTNNSFIYRTEDITDLEYNDERKNIVIAYALYNPAESIDIEDGIDYSIKIGKAEEYNPLKEDTTNDYYYVEMGDFYGNPIRWRLISTDGGTTRYTYQAGQVPTGNGVFIQETTSPYYVTIDWNDSYPFYTERPEDEYYALNYCAFNPYKYDNNTKQYYLINENGEYIDANGNVTAQGTVLANDYFASNIRKYLNGTEEVYKKTTYNNGNYIYDTTGDKSNMLKDYDIDASNYVYNKISGRTLNSMLTNMSGSENNDSVWTYTNATLPTGISGTTTDKFWLLSVDEVLRLLCGVTDNTWGEDEWSGALWGEYTYTDETGGFMGDYYWLRSPYSSSSRFAHYVNYYGGCYGNGVHYSSVAARAAFNLAI